MYIRILIRLIETSLKVEALTCHQHTAVVESWVPMSNFLDVSPS